MARATIRQALAAESPLVTVLAHDALSARLIERAGFRAFNIGGSTLLAARYALPDIGLVGLGEMIDGMREIAAATSLPFIADADDGYGDVKATCRTVREYERLGVGALLLEDQLRDHKKPRAERSHGVAEREVTENKIRAALETRISSETLIFGRTDALGAVGLDEALIRAERYLKVGADGVFIAGLRRMEDFTIVAERLGGALLIAALFEGGEEPAPTVAELGAIGFSQVTFPASIILRATDAMMGGMEAIRQHASTGTPLKPFANNTSARSLLDDAVEYAAWDGLTARFAGSKLEDSRIV